MAALAGLRIRPLGREDQQHLWHWLHIALWDPPPAGLRPREVLEAPQVRIYAEDWDKPGDIGVVGELDGRPVGACWLRLLPVGVGLASVDERTPQLGIAVVPVFQGRGFGRAFMRAALRAAQEHGYHQVSLTVHPLNPSIRLYESCGFVKRGLRNTYHVMVATLE